MLDSLTALTKEQDVRALATLSVAEEQRFKYLTDLKRDLLASDPKKRHLDFLREFLNQLGGVGPSCRRSSASRRGRM